MRNTIEAEALIYQSGVTHDDFAPRSVLLVGSEDYEHGKFRAVLVDYNMSAVNRPGWRPSGSLEKMVNPVFRPSGHMQEFSGCGWLPSDHEKADRWRWRSFHNDKHHKYIKMRTLDNGELYLDDDGCPEMLEGNGEDQSVAQADINQVMER